MRKTYRIALLLCCILTALQSSWAQENTIAFNETFDTNTSSVGGRDGVFSGNSIGTGAPSYDNQGWTRDKVYRSYQCVRFGTANDNGTCTTPTITLTGTKYALLTYCAAGWGDKKNVENKISVTSSTDGVTLSGDCTNVVVENEEWNDYTVLIELPSAGGSFTLTFTGKRGFLDDVVVRNINTVPAPTLTEEYTFWPKTNEVNADQSVMLTPVSWTTVYYTTDGSTPSNSNGQVATMSTPVNFKGTTTVKAIAYVGNITSSVVSKTYTQGATVNGITAFNALAEGTEARLQLDDTPETRITFANSEEAYLRTGTEVLCLDFNTTATFNPLPATQQHVAGWIIGKRQTVNGRPTLVATANTNTNYLVLAPRKSEALITPNAIAASAINSHIGDWVSINELKVVNTANTFGLTSAQPYEDAIVDVTGIVTATNTIAPTEAVTFVIDEAQAFASPATDLEHAKVRLKRTLSSSYWNTFCVPFDITIMEGARKFDHMDGTVMVFQDATGIEAGKPYLVKPAADIANPEYNDVTLKSTPAQTSGNGNYSFIGTYSPTDLATDHTQLFLGTDGKLYYPANDASKGIKGLRAYFSMPAGAHIGLMIDGETTGIDLTPALSQGEGAWYDLQGRKIVNGTLSNGKLPKGLYIVNGKKMVIH